MALPQSDLLCIELYTHGRILAWTPFDLNFHVMKRDHTCENILEDKGKNTNAIKNTEI